MLETSNLPQLRNMSWHRLFFLLFMLCTPGSWVKAQSSNVTSCIAEYEWSINDRNQTPCLVAAYLESACNPNQLVEVNSIPVGNHYTGPSIMDADPCHCNVVVYSLISACGGCQNRTFTNWANFTANCSFSNMVTFPEPIPSKVDIPAWAYLNISLTNDTFDPGVAEAAAQLPPPSTSTSESATTTTVTTVSPPPTSSQTTPPPANNSTSHAGAIAGGVVGGIAVIVAASLGVFWFFRPSERRRRRISRDAVNLIDDGMNQADTANKHAMTPTPFTGPISNQTIATATTSSPTVTSAVHTTYPHSMSTIPYPGSLQFSASRGNYPAEI